MGIEKDINEESRGQWRTILTALGVDEKFMRNRHGPCPMCGGKDRYRFDDVDGNGTYFCSKCGSGTGVRLVMGINNVDFRGAVKLIRSVMPKAFEQKAHEKKKDAKKVDAEKMALMKAAWKASVPTSRSDDAGLYLARRGLEIPNGVDVLRTHPGLEYRDSDGKVVGSYPCMIAAIREPSGKPVGIHRTWLYDGKKAPVEQPKKSFGKSTATSAIMLYTAREVLGVAEGIETAIAAHMMFKIPVWSLISASQMERWSWPATVRKLIVFGDADDSFTGQKAAYTLGYRAKSKGLDVEVHIPQHHNVDWNDILPMFHVEQ